MSHRLIVLLLALSLSAACSSSWLPKTPGSRRAEEIRRLKERVLELQQQARMSEVEIERLRRQIAELRGSTGTQPVTVPDEDPVPPAENKPLAPPMVEPSVESEELAPAPANGVIAQQHTGEPVSPALSAPSAPSAPSAASGPPVESPNAQALYDQGYTLYHQGRLVDSESAFQQFLQSHSGSDLADNAQFWIGAARLQRGDTRGALAAFRETIERFPEGNKVPDAMLKSGHCLEQLGDSEAARRTYREIIARFPNTAAAALARERLEKLP